MKVLLSDLFEYDTGNLPALELTDDGDIPLIYGTTKNNGVIKLVKTDSDSKIFSPPLITVSYLGTAFVQRTKFTTSVVDKSNITILKPKIKMDLDELYYYCMQINRIAKFGYSYGRRMNQKQLNKIYLEKYEESYPVENIKNYLPSSPKKAISAINFSSLKAFSVLEIFNIEKGEGAYLETVSPGKTPLISATSFNNGVVDYIDVPPIFKKGTITIERIKSTAFVQLFDYVTVPDDVYVLSPIREMEISELYFFCYLIRREAWKYSYGRKLTKNRLENIVFHLPINKGKIDIVGINKIFNYAYGNNVVSNIYDNF